MNSEEKMRGFGIEKCDICSSFKGPPRTTDEFVSGDHRYCQCPSTSSTSLIRMRQNLESEGANGGGGWYGGRLEGGARQEEEHFLWGNHIGEGASNRSSSDEEWVHVRPASTWLEERKSLQKKLQEAEELLEERKSLQKKLQEAEELIQYKDIEIEELVNAHRQLRSQNSQREKEKLKEDLQRKTEQLERAKTEIARLEQYVLVYKSYFNHLVARARDAEAQVAAYRYDTGRERQTLYQMQLNLNQNPSMHRPGTEPSLHASQSMDQAPATTATTARSTQQSVRLLPPRPGHGRLDGSQNSRSTSSNHHYGRLEIDGEQSDDEEAMVIATDWSAVPSRACLDASQSSRSTSSNHRYGRLEIDGEQSDDEETMVIGIDWSAVPSSATMDIPTDDQEDHL